MKIVFSNKALNNPGGTERVTSILSRELAERGHEVHIISFIGKDKEPFFNIDSRVNLHYLAPTKDKYPFPIRDIRRIVLMKKIYKQINPDIIIIVDAGRSFVNIPASRGYKTITWEHFNVDVNWHLGHRLSRKIAAKYSDLIVTLTEPAVEAYKTKFKAKNAICIYNPVTIDASVPSSLDKKVCMAMGWLGAQKNFIDLINAWYLTKAHKEGWKLRIIGQGKQQTMLENQISKLGLENTIEMLPPQKNVVEQYKNASVYAMSSRNEGLPLVLIEAMAMGLPIVSYDCPTGPADIVSHEKTGLLIPYLNVEALAEGLDRVMLDEDLRKKFHEESLKEVEKFSVKTIVDKWETVFKNI
ncbi:MAG: glycosyltransferase family 4 protein [Paludibacteraceae bacterium]|nr:glycosyltransferase family 4 protein [Paludibacteraceae bacterium]MBR2492550.1 glycosyltransferase family 4 protein [Paludibacteraceae bacterium]MBR6686556.1 glycosyltransferase family 4 protein [Paludibacteraceae bacterium]